jgi:hypothetical protein
MKVCGEIEYEHADGHWIHSDICPLNCDSENIEHTFVRETGNFTYREYLHQLLDEWLDKSKGTGCFYIKDAEFKIENEGEE